MAQIEFQKARNYIGIGLRQVGERVEVADDVAKQLEKQGFAKMIEPAQTRPRFKKAETTRDKPTEDSAGEEDEK